MRTESDSADRFQRALAEFLQWQDSKNPDDPDEFLEKHEELRSELERLIKESRGGREITRETVADDEDSHGRVLGQFRILREIGRGAMGTVFEARQIGLNRRVAIKTLPAALSLSEDAVERFKREAKTAAKLKIPGVAQIYGVGKEGRTHYLAMELVVGAPLDYVIEEARGAEGRWGGDDVMFAVSTYLHRRLIREDDEDHGYIEDELARSVFLPSYVDTCVAVMAQVADTLHRIHRVGIIHRDVKPENILLRADGSTMLTDFGLARADDLPSLTLTGEFAGTPAYAAPEQVSSKVVEVDYRADIFSFGAALYEMLTFECPFDDETVAAVVQRILHRNPTDPSKLNPDIPSDLSAVVMKALEKKRTRRYRSAAEIANDLRRYLAGQKVQARPRTLPRRVGEWFARKPAVAATLTVLPVVLAIAAVVIVSLASRIDELESERDTLVAAANAERDAAEAALTESRARVWRVTLASLARDPRFEGLTSEQQRGLVPIHNNPVTGLWEFAHLASGTLPEVASNGQLVPGDTSCIVFVLVPGDDRHPPSLISKWPLTIAAWTRLGGESPPDAPPMSPIVGPTPRECQRRLREAGLALPTTERWRRTCAIDPPASNGAGDGGAIGGKGNRYGIADLGRWPELCEGGSGLVRCSLDSPTTPQLVDPAAAGDVAIRAVRPWK